MEHGSFHAQQLLKPGRPAKLSFLLRLVAASCPRVRAWQYSLPCAGEASGPKRCRFSAPGAVVGLGSTIRRKAGRRAGRARGATKFNPVRLVWLLAGDGGRRA